MKNIYVSAITLVIAGLVLTSSLSVGKPTVVSSEIKNEQPTTVDRSAAISAFLNNPTSFTPVKNVQKSASLVSHLEHRAITPAETQSTVAQSSDVILTAVPEVRKTRQSLNWFVRHPGFADNGEGNFLLVCQETYNISGEIFNGLVFQGSNDYGHIWGDPIYLEGPYSQPSIAYWGKNGSIDRWYVTFRNDGDPSIIPIIKWETDMNTIMDLTNASSEYVYWSFGPQGITDYREPQIACTDKYGSQFSFIISCSTDKSPYNNKPTYLVQESEPSGVMLSSFNLNGVLGNDCSIDETSDFSTLVWDPVYSTYGHSFLLEWTKTLEQNQNKVYIWYDPSGNYEYTYPAVKVNDHNIIMALEAQNTTAMTPQELEIDHFVGAESPVDYSWVEGASWSSPTINFRYPEVAHVQADTFIVTCIAENITSGSAGIYLTVTYDAGATWTDLFLWSGTDLVDSVYRSNEMSVGGQMLIWQYAYDDGEGDDLIILHYDFLTVKLQGTVYYPEGDPAAPTTVVVENLDPVNGGVIPGVKIMGSNYLIKLILGLDIWLNAAFKVTASEGLFVGSAEHIFATIEHVNTFDDIFYYFIPWPTMPVDATAWHTVAADKNKGICGRGISYTFTTTSTQSSGNIFYTFFWGDGTFTEVGPYASGAVASASHSWALTALGNNSVYATARIGSQTSTASPILLVKMFKLADCNGNGVVDNFDISPFVKALTGGKTGYYTAYPAGYYYTADCSMNQVVDNFDINPFVKLLTSG